MNCLVKRLAMAVCLVQVLEDPSGYRKVMGWFGGGREFLPDSAPSRVQKGLGLDRGETERTFSLHLERADSSVRWVIWVLRA